MLENIQFQPEVLPVKENQNSIDQMVEDQRYLEISATSLRKGTIRQTAMESFFVFSKTFRVQMYMVTFPVQGVSYNYLIISLFHCDKSCTIQNLRNNSG